eukprot:TRINITY_DN16373_c1_g2_i1.p1 TRINITY_DN16373_c1_g2~~TRINITY_DN16373_c1_g2_i1.p1  ORF type:complete len:1659 (-),score=247.63 TRINITY_DN16373_c1_g2_i1:83-4996(-)
MILVRLVAKATVYFSLANAHRLEHELASLRQRKALRKRLSKLGAADFLEDVSLLEPALAPSESLGADVAAPATSTHSDADKGGQDGAASSSSFELCFSQHQEPPEGIEKDPDFSDDWYPVTEGGNSAKGFEIYKWISNVSQREYDGPKKHRVVSPEAPIVEGFMYAKKDRSELAFQELLQECTTDSKKYVLTLSTTKPEHKDWQELTRVDIPSLMKKGYESYYFDQNTMFRHGAFVYKKAGGFVAYEFHRPGQTKADTVKLCFSELMPLEEEYKGCLLKVTIPEMRRAGLDQYMYRPKTEDSPEGFVYVMTNKSKAFRQLVPCEEQHDLKLKFVAQAGEVKTTPKCSSKPSNVEDDDEREFVKFHYEQDSKTFPRGAFVYEDSEGKRVAYALEAPPKLAHIQLCFAKRTELQAEMKESVEKLKLCYAPVTNHDLIDDTSKTLKEYTYLPKDKSPTEGFVYKSKAGEYTFSEKVTCGSDNVDTKLTFVLDEKGMSDHKHKCSSQAFVVDVPELEKEGFETYYFEDGAFIYKDLNGEYTMYKLAPPLDKFKLCFKSVKTLTTCVKDKIKEGPMLPTTLDRFRHKGYVKYIYITKFEGNTHFEGFVYERLQFDPAAGVETSHVHPLQLLPDCKGKDVEAKVTFERSAEVLEAGDVACEMAAVDVPMLMAQGFKKYCYMQNTQFPDGAFVYDTGGGFTAFSVRRDMEKFELCFDNPEPVPEKVKSLDNFHECFFPITLPEMFKEGYREYKYVPGSSHSPMDGFLYKQDGGAHASKDDAFSFRKRIHCTSESPAPLKLEFVLSDKIVNGPERKEKGCFGAAPAAVSIDRLEKEGFVSYFYEQTPKTFPHGAFVYRQADSSFTAYALKVPLDNYHLCFGALVSVPEFIGGDEYLNENLFDVTVPEMKEDGLTKYKFVKAKGHPVEGFVYLDENNQFRLRPLLRNCRGHHTLKLHFRKPSKLKKDTSSEARGDFSDDCGGAEMLKVDRPELLAEGFTQFCYVQNPKHTDGAFIYEDSEGKSVVFKLEPPLLQFGLCFSRLAPPPPTLDLDAETACCTNKVTFPDLLQGGMIEYKYVFPGKGSRDEGFLYRAGNNSFYFRKFMGPAWGDSECADGEAMKLTFVLSEQDVLKSTTKPGTCNKKLHLLDVRMTRLREQGFESFSYDTTQFPHGAFIFKDSTGLDSAYEIRQPLSSFDLCFAELTPAPQKLTEDKALVADMHKVTVPEMKNDGLTEYTYVVSSTHSSKRGFLYSKSGEEYLFRELLDSCEKKHDLKLSFDAKILGMSDMDAVTCKKSEKVTLPILLEQGFKKYCYHVSDAFPDGAFVYQTGSRRKIVYEFRAPLQLIKLCFAAAALAPEELSTKSDCMYPVTLQSVQQHGYIRYKYVPKDPKDAGCDGKDEGFLYKDHAGSFHFRKLLKSCSADSSEFKFVRSPAEVQPLDHKNPDRKCMEKQHDVDIPVLFSQGFRKFSYWQTDQYPDGAFIYDDEYGKKTAFEVLEPLLAFTLCFQALDTVDSKDPDPCFFDVTLKELEGTSEKYRYQYSHPQGFIYQNQGEDQYQQRRLTPCEASNVDLELMFEKSTKMFDKTTDDCPNDGFHENRIPLLEKHGIKQIKYVQDKTTFPKGAFICIDDDDNQIAYELTKPCPSAKN